MKTHIILITLLIFNLSVSHAQTNGIFNVKDFGAIGQKKQIATKQIQDCIDACFKSNGGTVYFSPGEYTSGTIVLRDNVILHLDAGATLYASREEKDFQYSALIYANGAKNISITGKGKIDGQAVRTYEDLQQVDGFIGEITENARKSGIEMKMYYKVSPLTYLIILESCRNVRVRDISLIESTSWTLHFKWCENVFIDNIYLASSLEKGVNADGIDIDGSKNVVVTNSIIETGDDAIVLKSTLTGNIAMPCENITVTNCILTSTSTALKLGTESHADFRHIIFSNCVIRNSNRALSIVIRDGAAVDNVIFSNITIETNRKAFFWWGNADPIWVVLLKRNPDSKLGSISNITFENIIANGQGTSKIEGYEGKPLENIKLDNVQFYITQESLADKRATDVFYAHDVKGLQMTNCKAVWDTDRTEPKWNVPFHFKNISSLQLNNLSGKQPFKTGSMILCENVTDALITQCMPQSGTDNFLHLNGINNSILVQNNFLQHVNVPYLYSNGANPKMILGK